MYRKFTVFGLLVVASLVFSACAPAQPAPDASATYQSAVETAVATIFVGKTLEAAAVTQTPYVIVVTATPPPPTPTPVVVTATPAPNFLYVNCGIRWQIDFIVDNYNAMDPKRLNNVGSRLLNHFDINKGKLTFTKPGIKDDETKIGQILDTVKGAWVPDWQGVPSAYKDFHDAEVAYLESMIEASKQGRKGDLSEAYSALLSVNSYAYAINGNYLSHVCGYNFQVPTRP